ncbi:uncharacterized protein LOC119927187 [Tachyglossus aculeatus]|uniref:uncharacterized protein LOC119927187 n=1 Tax=Tachyglossus aculeatus TaxID=9261 RepID=UPI0018F49A8D|nr:uncharacterized protein LOC119927187 [Tachyglossus aculeatus]
MDTSSTPCSLHPHRVAKMRRVKARWLKECLEEVEKMVNRLASVFTRKCSTDQAAFTLIFVVLSQLYGWGKAQTLPPPDTPAPYYIPSGDMDWYNSRRRAKFISFPSRLPLANTPTLDTGSSPSATKLAVTVDAICFEFVKAPEEVLEKKNLKPPSPQDTLKTDIFACLVAIGFLLIIVTVFQILIFSIRSEIPMKYYTYRICKNHQLNSGCESVAEKQMQSNVSSRMGDFPLRDFTSPSSATQPSITYREAQYSPYGTSTGETPMTSPRSQTVYESSLEGSVSVLEPGDTGDLQGESSADEARWVEDRNSPSWKTGQGNSE